MLAGFAEGKLADLELDDLDLEGGAAVPLVTEFAGFGATSQPPMKPHFWVVLQSQISSRVISHHPAVLATAASKFSTSQHFERTGDVAQLGDFVKEGEPPLPDAP